MTEHEAVDLALRRLAGVPLTKDFLLGLRGVGWGAEVTNGLPVLGVDRRLDFRQASAIYPAVRRQGRTVRSLVDCLIAAITPA